MVKNGFGNNSVAYKCSFYFNVKIHNYKYNFISLLYSLRGIDYTDDRDNYMIDPHYFYRLMVKKVNFGSTYSFIITYNNKPLVRDGIPFGSILYTFPETSLRNAKLINNNERVKLKLNDINKDFIFTLPKQYKELDINTNDLELYISYKVLMKYEILKLQWEFTSMIKSSDLVKEAKAYIHEEGDMEKDLKLKLNYFQVVK